MTAAECSWIWSVGVVGYIEDKYGHLFRDDGHSILGNGNIHQGRHGEVTLHFAAKDVITRFF